VCGNGALIACLAETSLTEVGLAEAINAVVEDITGVPGRTSDRWVRMLLRGSIRWPHHQHRRALEIILGRPLNELGLRPRVRTTSPDCVEIPIVSSRIRLGASDVARLREPFDTLVRNADQYGAQTLAPRAAQYATSIQNMMRDAVVSQRIERRLYVLIGDYLAAAGWFALDAGGHMPAQRYLDTALRVAGVARDQSLLAYVWSVTEKRLRHCGEFGQALAVAKTGLASTAARRNCRTRATFHALMAINLSRRGEKAQARRSLGRAFDAFHDAIDFEPPGRWFFTDSGFVNAAGASVSLTLGQLSEAERYGQRAVEGTRMSQTRNQAMRQLSLANIYVEMRELEYACANATSVLTLVQQLRSRRLTYRLQPMRNLLTKWYTVPVVRDWNARYDQWVQQVKTGYLGHG
jgi:hypothetical protein